MTWYKGKWRGKDLEVDQDRVDSAIYHNRQDGTTKVARLQTVIFCSLSVSVITH